MVINSFETQASEDWPQCLRRVLHPVNGAILVAHLDERGNGSLESHAECDELRSRREESAGWIFSAELSYG